MYLFRNVERERNKSKRKSCISNSHEEEEEEDEKIDIKCILIETHSRKFHTSFHIN